MLITKLGQEDKIVSKNPEPFWGRQGIEKESLEKEKRERAAFHLKTPTAPGSSIIDKGNSRGYLSQRFAKARRRWPCATCRMQARVSWVFADNYSAQAMEMLTSTTSAGLSPCIEGL